MGTPNITINVYTFFDKKVKIERNIKKQNKQQMYMQMGQMDNRCYDKTLYDNQ